ncbi:hypothetical protein BJ322DRAFT_1064540 [Thelephora terrestris]|uniref:Uncharacterized protein n=1 Tax=Thelephora terrestris TaxID=56493 RepID=A0A9P6HCL7_9AGAM|nr:hypothetical protein BJ322DRAFT_1064540 [Thelephora terrestris]
MSASGIWYFYLGLLNGMVRDYARDQSATLSSTAIMPQSIPQAHSNSAQDIATLVTNNIALNFHFINNSLDDLLAMLSSSKAGEPEIDDRLESVIQELDSLVITKGKEEEEIKTLLQSVLDREVKEHLTREIQQRVDESIDQTITQLVESSLDEYIPKALRDKIDQSREELSTVWVKLHNIDARRQNASIKTAKHKQEQIYQILKESGETSEHFPPSVAKLLELKDQEISKLLKFYGKSPSGKKPDDINCFLEFCGVTFRHVHG